MVLLVTVVLVVVLGTPERLEMQETPEITGQVVTVELLVEQETPETPALLAMLAQVEVVEVVGAGAPTSSFRPPDTRDG